MRSRAWVTRLACGPRSRTHAGRQVGECLTSKVHAPRVARPTGRRRRPQRGRWTRRRGARQPGPVSPTIAGADPRPRGRRRRALVRRLAPLRRGARGANGARAASTSASGPPSSATPTAARVEILQPWKPEDNPFLRRFLDRHGPGPHHLTFKVPDLASALDDARASGFSPVGVDLTNADWKEAFLHPRQATGIVVQMAQAAYDVGVRRRPKAFPTDRTGPACVARARHPRRGGPRRRLGPVRGSPRWDSAPGTGRRGTERGSTSTCSGRDLPPSVWSRRPRVAPSVAPAASRTLRPGWAMPRAGSTTWPSRSPATSRPATATLERRGARGAARRRAGPGHRSSATTSARASCSSRRPRFPPRELRTDLRGRGGRHHRLR